MNTLVRNYDYLPSLFNTFFNEATPANSFSPSANIKETDTSFEVELALPGFKKDDFKIEVNDKMLTISSEISNESEEKKENYIRQEFSYKSFSRSFRLPRTVDSEKIEATYENGVLSLNIPKKEEAKVREPRLISVN